MTESDDELEAAFDALTEAARRMALVLLDVTQATTSTDADGGVFVALEMDRLTDVAHELVPDGDPVLVLLGLAVLLRRLLGAVVVPSPEELLVEVRRSLGG